MSASGRPRAPAMASDGSLESAASMPAASPGRTLTREQLLDDLHGSASSLDRSVDSHIKNLRKKLEAASGEAMIETVYGVGYRFLEK